MKTYLISHKPLWDMVVWTSASDINFLKKIYTTNLNNDPSEESTWLLILDNPISMQTNRIQVASQFMRDQDFIIIHWILCVIKNKNVLIWWASHSGKTYMYQYLYKHHYINDLYDEDLCCLYIHKNQAFSLSDFSFKGQVWKKYIYDKNSDNIYGSIDYVFLLDPWKENVKKIELTSDLITKYLVHPLLHNHEPFYARSSLKYKVSTYIIGNNYHQSHDIHIKNAAFILKKIKCAK